MGNFPRGVVAPKVRKLIHRIAMRSTTGARAGIAEPLEHRQMLSGSVVPSRGPLSTLDSTLQTTYLDYQHFLADQPVSSMVAKTKKQKLAKAAAVTAVSKTFQPNDSSLHASSGNIPVQAFAKPGDRTLLIAALKKLSGQNVSSSGREVDADIPIADLATLASLKSLRFAETSASVVNVGAVTSQGDTADQASLARAAYGINGAGVKVGIISDSFNNNVNPSITDTYSTDQASGDLPAGVQILSDNVPGTDEGRAIAQVIYDSAPGASLAFATGDSANAALGPSTMASNIGALVSDGANIIVDDVTYKTEPMFADGIIAQAAETAIGDGVTYISAAGNLGEDSYASVWRSGPTLSQGSISKDPTQLNAPTFYGGVAFNFNTSGGTNDMESFTLANGAVFNPSLQWDSPYYSTGGPGTSNQVDVYVLNAAGTQVEGGSSAQVTGGDPIQLFQFQNSTGTAQTYNLMICCSIGSVPGYIKYVDFAGQATNWQVPQNSSTIFGHANASGVESVGAVNYANTPAFGTNTPVVESYSSTGGTPIIFNPAGGRLPSYGYRQSPEVVAPDDVFTTFFGTKVGNDAYPSFSGTSASAAEVAGLAALLIQKDPKFTPAQVDAAINNNTIAMGSTSPNNQSGYGLVQALPVISHSVGNITGTVFFDQNGNGKADPGEAGIGNALVYIDLHNSGMLQTGDPVTSTNSNGSFAFYNQSLGSTIVRLVNLSGYVQTDGAQTVNVLGATTVSGVYFGLIPTQFSGTSGGYNYMLQVDQVNTADIDIFIGGALTYTAPLSILQGGLTFDLEGGNASFTVNFANGDPMPSGGVDFTPTGTGNSLIFNGTSAADTAIVDGDTTSFDPAVSNGAVTADDVQTEIINGNGGNDNFTVATAQPIGETLTFNGSTGTPGNATLSVDDILPNNGTTTFFNAGTSSSDQNTLNVNAGTWTFPTDPGATSANLTVNDNGAVVFAAGKPSGGINTRSLAALNISAGSIATVAVPDTHTDRAVLVLSTISIAVTGILDLTSNDMVVTSGDLPSIAALVGSGYNNGAWNGNGIQSSAAAGDTTHLTALGVIANNVTGNRLYGNNTTLGPFDGMNTSSSSILVKYTYYGDTDLSGSIDGSDYSRVDNGFTQQLTGWFNGDFNYDGVVDGSDYTLIDNAFNVQGDSL